MPRLRAEHRRQAYARGEHIDVISRIDRPPLPLTPLEQNRIVLTFALATVVDIGREAVKTSDDFGQYTRRRLPDWERCLELSWDLLRAFRSGEYVWLGSGQVLPRTVKGRVDAVMADGEPHSASEVAERIGAKLSTVRQYLWEMSRDDPRRRLQRPGWFQFPRTEAA